MKIVFFGSSSFAVASLQMLKTKHEIAAVFTQPDRRKGRHLHLAKTPVKMCAEKSAIEIFQPENISSEKSIETLKNLKADLFVVVSYGQKLSNEVLNIPRLYCINVHASLLPKYRGAAPINYCLINAEKTTGVSIMKMNEFMDAGDIILSKEIQIDEDDDAVELSDKLSKLGAQALMEAIDNIEKNKVEFIKQDESKVSTAYKLKKSHGLIDWNRDAKTIHNQVRGLLPWPCAYTYYKGKFLKILKSVVRHCPDERSKDIKPGEVIVVCPHQGIVIACGQEELRIEKLQIEGKKAMDAYAFVIGHHVKKGDMFANK